MNRKKFLASFTTASALLFTDIAQSAVVAKPKKIIIPPYLQRGETIGITSPAGYIAEKDIQPAVEQIQKWGFKIVQGNTIGKRDFSFGGTDEERRADFQSMINNPEIKAILCARGGYGAGRIIDQLDFSPLTKTPKWVIGFSDITVFHNHLHTNSGIATIHSKMCNSFPAVWATAEPIQVDTIMSIQKVLTGEKMQYKAEPHVQNKPGVAEGLLVGGNLKMIETLGGTASDLVTDGKILFVEDVGEALYSIDRMFCNLKRTGKLAKLKALLVGGFTSIKTETPGEEFGRNLYEIVHEKIREYDYPVCFGFPVGHQRNNFAFKCGVRHRITINPSETILEEI